MNKKELEERLINFAVLIIEINESMPERKSASHMGGQLLRSGTSPALNYGEAQSAESSKDFIHKMKVVLKELRESNNSLKIIHKSELFTSDRRILDALKECNELISIFVASIKTASRGGKK
jgi:four helix bundle protein